MRKTKFLLTAFAVFAAILMLSTISIARPIQEKTSIEIIDKAEKELANSLEQLSLQLSRDFEANILLSSIANDPEVILIANTVERVGSQGEILSGIEQLAVVLQGNAEFEQLVTILEEDYSSETEAISLELESMNYDTSGLGRILDIIIIVIQIIIQIFQIIKGIINLINLIIDLFKSIFGGGDDGGDEGTPAY